MEPRHTWLTTLERRSLGDFDLTPALDRDLSARAQRARTDPAELEALYTLLATKIARFSNRFHSWRTSGVPFDDVLQETYLALADVVYAWPTPEHSEPPAGFTPYFLRVFPARLHDRVRALATPAPARALGMLLDGTSSEPVDPVDVASDAVTNVALGQICQRLDAEETALLLHRLAGRRFDARQLQPAGINASRRTAYRRWRHITHVARAVYGEPITGD